MVSGERATSPMRRAASRSAGDAPRSPGAAGGSSSSPAASPAVAYATVYPLVMLLRVFSAQLVVFLFYQAAGG